MLLCPILKFMGHRVVEKPPILIRLQKVWFSHDYMVRVKNFVIHADLLHFVVFQVENHVFNFVENLVAHGATCNPVKPIINAVLMEDMEAAKQPTLTFVSDSFHAYHAFGHKVLSIFHPDQGRLYAFVCLGREDPLDSKPCAGYVPLQIRVRLRILRPPSPILSLPFSSLGLMISLRALFRIFIRGYPRRWLMSH